MKFKNIKLEWYVFRHSFNEDELEYFNVLDERFIEEIKKCLKSKDSYYKISSRDDLKERIRKYFMWRYWGKCEYEVLIQGLFSKNEKTFKEDVWFQLEPNLDTITDLVISKMEIDFYKEAVKTYKKICKEE